MLEALSAIPVIAVPMMPAVWNPADFVLVLLLMQRDFACVCDCASDTVSEIIHSADSDA